MATEEQKAAARADVYKMLDIAGMVTYAKSTKGKLALLAEMVDNADEEATALLRQAKAWARA